MKKYNLKAALASLLLVLFLALYTVGCADDPSSLGLNFIPPGETTGVRIFDSFIDTMPITSVNKVYYVNTSGSTNLMVGKNGNYDAKALIRFGGLSDQYDSAVVVSATMTLSYRNYYFPSSPADSLGQISFSVNKILQSINFSTVTLDSVNSSAFGNTSMGNYTGTPTADSQDVSFALNPSLVKDWLEYAADTGYSVKNYGIALTPDNSSGVIKAFYSGLAAVSGSVRPRLQIIVTKNNNTDTLFTDGSETVSLVDAAITPGNETFNLQAGVSFVQVMQFDLSHFPQSATINDVQLYLALDSANSVFSNQSSYSIFAQYVSDSAGPVTDVFPFPGSSAGNGTYMIRLVSNQVSSPFQRWLYGHVNYGIMLFAGNQTINLDRYVFYKENAADPNKRPRVKIKYTPRVTP